MRWGVSISLRIWCRRRGIKRMADVERDKEPAAQYSVLGTQYSRTAVYSPPLTQSAPPFTPSPPHPATPSCFRAWCYLVWLCIQRQARLKQMVGIALALLLLM